MDDPFLKLLSMIEKLNTKSSNTLIVGPVEEIDAVKGFRIKLGETDEGPYLSPWYPHPESGGKSRTWMPLTKGQIVSVSNPNGDSRQGTVQRAGFTDEFPPPSDKLDENRFEFGALSVSATGGGDTLTITLGDSSIVMTSGNIKLISPKIDLN